MTFQEKLVKLRKENRMTQEDLAGVIGISRQAIAKWEAGQSLPDMSNLITLSEYFHISVDRLIKDDLLLAEEPVDGALYPGSLKEKQPWHYEYKSERTLFGLPLVHINVGRRGRYRAKGILAVGNTAKGFVSIGWSAIGLFSVGLASVGLFSIGLAALGLLAFGGVVTGMLLAVGGIACGLVAVGGVSAGMIAVGGVATGTHIAVGGVVAGRVAIGSIVAGEKVLRNSNLYQITALRVEQVVRGEFPDLWEPLIRFVCSLFR